MVVGRRYATRRKAIRRFKRRSASRGVRRRGTKMGSRVVRKLRRWTSRNMRINHGLAGSIVSLVPPVKYVTHTYQYVSGPTKYGVSGDLVADMIYPISPYFLVNSVYDPNSAITGVYNESATLYDYMTRIYNRSEVVSCKAVFIFRQADTVNPDVDIGFGVRLDDDASLATTSTSWLHTRVDPRNRTAAMKCTPNRDGLCAIKHSWNSKLWSAGYKADNDAATGYSPTTRRYFVPYIGTAWGTDSVGSPHIVMSVRLYMRVRWTDPRDITGNNSAGMEQA